MATWDDVAAIAATLPEPGTRLRWGNHSWTVKDKAYAWVRPLTRSDVRALTERGRPIPDEPILAVSVADLGEKEAVLAEYPDVLFDIPHFDQYAAVLVRLERIDVPLLTELLTDAWLARAPRRAARDFLARGDGPGSPPGSGTIPQ